MNVEIRFAAASDAETLARAARESFYDAFAAHPKNAPEDLRAYMDAAFSLDAIRAELNDADTTFFVAETAGAVAGYAKLKRNSREDCVGGANPLELCRLYALDEFIGKGVGKTLMLHCLKYAAENAHDFLWLGVWEYNHRAQKFYERFGFEKCGEHVFQLGNDPQIDWVMQKQI